MDWSNTFCIVTGVSGGIGQALAEEFGAVLGQNSVLVLQSRSKQSADKIANGITAKNPKVTVATVQWDLSNPDAAIFRKDLTAAAAQTSKGVGGFQHLLVLHNAARLGDMGARVELMDDAQELKEHLTVNVVSMIVLNSVVLQVFKAVPKKTVVNFTSRSAYVPQVSFGVSAMVKPPREFILNVLALENPDVKVLHFDPGSVDTAALKEILLTTHNAHAKESLKAMYEEGKVLTPKQTATVLVHLVAKGYFQSGCRIDTITAMNQGYGN